MEEKKIYFLVGIGRSGTTILSKLLNEHPDIHGMPEANFFVFFLNKFGKCNSFSIEDIELIFNQIEVYMLSHPFVGWEFDVKTVKENTINRNNTSRFQSYTELCKFIYMHFKVYGMDKQNASVLLDKNPSYTLYVDKIRKQIPTTKFIYLLRDYRANVLSRKQSVYIKSPNVAFNAFRWKLFNKQTLLFLEKYPEQITTIKYEELVKDQQKQMTKLFQFLGLDTDYKHECSSAVKQDISLFAVSEKYKDRFNKKYSDLDRPLNADRLDVWKNQLSIDEIKICEALSGDFAEKLGYKKITSMSLVEKYKYRAKYIVPILKAYWDVYKDFALFYVSPEIKLKRLEKKYHELGFYP